ncbi:MAG TPA: hypothetical protein PLQ13_01415 [Candidatus Krumholzibacteria bacterium]|nr:hypothetical protein [Candidatus Krumholzibacteria bacterium]
MGTVFRASRVTIGALLLTLALAAAPVRATPERWNGHPFVFVLMTDDGTKCNLGWAEVARERDFRFTIAVNAGKVTARQLTAAEMHQLAADGFEIAQHGHSHGFDGVPLTCPTPPKGSLQAYFDCPDLDPAAAAEALAAEISRTRLETLADLPCGSVRTLAYPRHLLSKELIETLVAAGFSGARYGENSSYDNFSGGDFTVPSRNSWDDGISLFRVPIAHYATYFFGDHSATPPVFYTHEQFVAAAQPLIDQAREQGGIFAIYAHHFGDTDDTWGDINYGSSGMTPTDLEWMVDLVRANDGTIMTFGDAVTYYRARSCCTDVDEDLVWVAANGPSSTPTSMAAASMATAPNPCNGGTTFTYVVAQPGPVRLALHDLKGRRIATIVDAYSAAGTWTAHWNGLDDGGRAVPSGVYVARLAEGGHLDAVRVTLLK